MKSIRNKKTSNSSFLSNHDLLENFRNKSFKLITREASLSELKQVPKKVSLIQKKTYDGKNNDNKQNDPLVSNRKMVSVNKGQTQRERPNQQINIDQQIHKVIKELNFVYDQIDPDEIELKMILNKNIRKVKEMFGNKAENITHKNQDALEKQLKEKIENMSQKIEDQSKKIFKYKKQNDLLKQKVSLYESQILSLQNKLQQQKKLNQSIFNSKNTQKTLNTNYSQPNVLQSFNQNSFKHSKRQQVNHEEGKQNKIQILQNIIDTQEQLISKQMSDFEAENQEFMRILKTQALHIEQLITDKSLNITQKASPKRFISHHQKSTASQSRFDSNRSYQKNVINHFSSFNSPQKTEDLIAKINNRNSKQTDFSICIY